MTWRKVIGYELGWQFTAKNRPGAISLRIEGPIGHISEEIADLINPARSIEEDSFRGYTWQEDRDPLETIEL